MSESWVFQLSLKIDGQHLLNMRADDATAFKDALAWAAENREPILAAVAALSPAPVRQNSATPRQAPMSSPGAAEREIGPLVLDNVEIKRAGKDGTVWKSPMFIVKWADGSASTFDQLIGKAAQGFWANGAQCYLTTAPSAKNPKFQNVVSIRSAVVS